MKITKSKKLSIAAINLIGFALIAILLHASGKDIAAGFSGEGTAIVEYSDEINEAASTYQLNPALIAAVIHAESNFRPHARSYVGAQGLMQIMPSTLRFLGFRNGYNPRQNILAGSKYLRALLDDFDNNLSFAIAAYNAGPGAVKRFSGIPPYKETRGYVKKVLKHYSRYQKIFDSDPMMS